MYIDRALKGHVTESIIEELLINAGYTVIPFGIEQIIRECKIASPDDYLKIVNKDLKKLRPTPDFLIVDMNEASIGEDKHATNACLAEIKYMKDWRWTFKGKNLRRTARYYCPFYFILAVANQPKSWKTGKGHISHLKVFRIEKPEHATSEKFFIDNPMEIHETFKRLHDTAWSGSVKKAANLILANAEAVDKFGKSRSR